MGLMIGVLGRGLNTSFYLGQHCMFFFFESMIAAVFFNDIDTQLKSVDLS